MSDERKKCSKCGAMKLFHEFRVEKRTRVGLQAMCRQCENERRRKPLKIKERRVVCSKCGGAEFYKSGKCASCTRAYSAEYRLLNPGRIKEAWAKWVAENKDKKNAHKRGWHQANKATQNEKSRLYQRGDPLGRRIREQNRRARKEANGGRLSRGLTEKLFALQRGRCACCGMPLGEDYQLDHIVPLALGGANEDRNIQLLRRECNGRKKALHPIDYMRRKGMLL